MKLEGAVVDCGYFQVGVSGLFLLDVVQEAALVVVVHPAEDARREPGQHQQHQRAFHVRHMVRHNCLSVVMQSEKVTITELVHYLRDR